MRMLHRLRRGILLKPLLVRMWKIGQRLASNQAIAPPRSHHLGDLVLAGTLIDVYRSDVQGNGRKRRVIDDDSEEESEVRRPASPQWLEKRDVSHMSSQELCDNRRQAQQQRRSIPIPKRKRPEYADVVSSSSDSDDNVITRRPLPTFDPIDHQLDDTPQKPMFNNSLTAQRSNLDRILQRGATSSRDDRLQRRKLRQQRAENEDSDNDTRTSSPSRRSGNRSTPISLDSPLVIDVSDTYDSDDSDNDGSALIEKSQRILSTCESLSSNLMHTISTWAAATEKAEPDLSKHCLAITSIAATSAITDVSHVCPTLSLQGYQLVGLNWLKLLDDHNVNGVLADAMGLGKTIQTIAFLSLLTTNSGRSPHLIIVPSSTLSNWKREISAHCPHLRAICYHGSQNDRYDLRREIADGIEDESLQIVLCTYSLFERDSGNRDRKYLCSIPWDYIILDEAHCIKNANSSRYANISNLHAKHRLLLSGTPVQNDVKELLSLLGFLMPRIFRASTIDTLLTYFGITSNIPASKQSMNNATIEELRRMLAPFVLRRRKEDVLLQLPKKETKVIEILMLDKQDKLYNDLIRSQLKSVESSANMAPQQAKHIFTSLRKAANHPLLLRQYYTNKNELMLIAKVSLAMGYFGDQCDINRVYDEICGYSDFDIHRICLEYENMLGHLKLGEDVLYDSPKMICLKGILPSLIVRMMHFGYFVTY